MNRSTRWRQLWLRATILASLALGLLAGPASAAIDFDVARSTSVRADSSVHWFGSTTGPVTTGGYQYTAYWDKAEPITGLVFLLLTRRKLSDDRMVTLRFTGEDSYLDLERINDGHNYVGLGIDPNDGTIHLSFSIHSGDRRHRYWRSEPGCTSLEERAFTLEACGFTFENYQAEATENSMTYPTYINDSTGGLYFMWRNGAASDGDAFMNIYNEATLTWSTRGVIIRGARTARAERRNEYTYEVGGGRRYTATERGVYPFGVAFDKNDRLHVSWVYRENGTSMAGQHGIYYAYSEVYARNWYNQAGTRVGTGGSDPIDIEDEAATRVIDVPPGYYMQGGNMTLDSDNNPHIFSSESDVRVQETYRINGRHTHYWRTTDGSWFGSYVEGVELPGSIHPTYGSMFLDRANNAYAIWAREDLGWVPGYGENYTQEEITNAHVTWQPGASREGLLDVQVKTELTCIDSFEHINVPISRAGNSQIRMRLRNATRETDPYIWWTTAESEVFRAERSETFTRGLRSESGYSEYTFRFSTEEWRGELVSLEFCIDGPTTGSMSIDWIKITDSAGRAAKTWEFTTGNKLYGAQAAQGDNWSRWTTEELLPGVNIGRDDAWWNIDTERYKERNRKVDFAALVQTTTPLQLELTIRSFDILGDEMAKDWRFEAELVGWTGVNVESLRWQNDSGTRVLSGSLDRRSADPILYSMENLRIPLGETTDRYVYVIMKNSTAARTAKVYFITDADRRWSEARAVAFPIRAMSGYERYIIDMHSVAGWRSNTLYQLRLDPTEDATTREGSFKVDRVYIMDR